MLCACAVLDNPSLGLHGFVEFNELENPINGKNLEIHIKITGLEPNSVHGIHIHEFGDLREGCDSVCSHYNPYASQHGDISFPRSHRHVGDLGNIKANKMGNVNVTLYDNLVKLRGKYSVIGRSVVLHQDPDDLGLGHNPDSLTTGNSGKRIACGIIGIARGKFPPLAPPFGGQSFSKSKC